MSRGDILFASFILALIAITMVSGVSCDRHRQNVYRDVMSECLKGGRPPAECQQLAVPK